MKKIISVTLISILALSGCMTTGNHMLKKETETTVQQKIVENKTTKSEIRKIFGSPDKTTFTDNGKEIWTYEFVDVSADAVSYIPVVNWFGSSASGTKKQLVVMFDGEVVYKYSMSEAEHKVKTGIFG
ncbi:hypothetical protein A3K93_01170 [Acinetobacter sp. NCu2D-2]|uniref:hypothetical protein n=1 Tax=Acinetobacter sp. NCu2D-2 TaxID=1608473 RepID=UPI0007CDF891|nr:hypothetical protein [Acinetobacter sp. NCu2D-2]ANF80932.1 hypothetical protein A3K93_01170 [Acinetobacter sp. NCu2D-2]